VARIERASGLGGAGSRRRKATGTEREDTTDGKETVHAGRNEIVGWWREGEERSSMRSGSGQLFDRIVRSDRSLFHRQTISSLQAELPRYDFSGNFW
jgi:hypothetical protein